MMIQALVEGEYRRMKIHHVPMRFSRRMDEVGRLRVRKLLELARVIFSILKARFEFGGEVLYYPPAGPNRIPVLRDVVILMSCRWLFRRTVFHFHAGGVSELLPELPWPLRSLASRAYSEPDVAILCAEGNPPDGTRLAAKRQVVLRHGIQDAARDFPADRRGPAQGFANEAIQSGGPVILFVGVLQESKGVLVLLEACRLLATKGIRFRCELVGAFSTESFEHTCRDTVLEYGLSDRIRFPGVLIGEAKWSAFRNADIFCFPTYFESESFGIVLLEAMQFGLPTVASRWRGIPDVVDSEVTGILIPPRNAEACASALERLLTDDALRRTMGEQARIAFENNFTLSSWRDRMEELLVEAAQ